MSRIFTTTLRLNLEDEADRRAWEYLQKLDKRQYRSYSKAIVAAVNGYFERQQRLSADPYLETREKEDAFLQRVMSSIQTGLQRTVLIPSAMSVPQQSVSQPQTDDEDLSAALDFADSF